MISFPSVYLQTSGMCGITFDKNYFGEHPEYYMYLHPEILI